MSSHKGFGKVILFGEHFIVYGLPGIASAISDHTTATIEDSDRFEFIDNRPETPGYKQTKKEEIGRQLDALLRHFNILREGGSVRITLGGNLVCASGVGASAALATSIARAFNERLKLGLDDDEINKVAYMAEEAGSGKPSGIDNTCSVFGGFITFRKNLAGGPNKIEKLKVRPVEIVMGNTGISQETKLVVEDVKRRKEADEAWFEGIKKDYVDTYAKAVDAIKKSDWNAVGRLMDRNQELLRQIGVSCDELEKLIRIAKDNCAWGAKLTGTGRGGYMVALTPWKGLQEKVAAAMKAAGFEVLKTTIGG
ncbi:MAG: mevalonate kinase [Candidatus Aenigmarchaeota archaeon]|nr:mevalonate kinase [Candidatus Aenigmarchaeota archaeon]